MSAVIGCEDVRPCISAGDGIAYDSSTGVVSADLSDQAGNNIAFGPDGGLFVPTGAATVSTGCGLTGDGSGSAPLTAATGTWPYECSVDDFGGVVVCDSNGVLRSEPRGQVSMTRYAETRTYNDVEVPSGAIQIADTFSTSITNPDTCRPAFVVVEREVDTFLVLPTGAGAATGFDGDEMYYTRNSGTSQINGAHSQATKVLAGGTLAPGASMTVSFGATVGRGSGGAYYYRIIGIIRALMISL
ncbi:hypothetical protein [Streptomyces sp. TRM68367]|uniref:hypothetical protein n=1 Tax=Streptomyces sp. TRM68367 TaxID=2758415 RepID=UPI00165BBA32|nr:hypothetical protein [Streptomyces sp. TRM68367]MBC9729251.1 hypothetical protein [Streptomyces sp. TRM68367]